MRILTIDVEDWFHILDNPATMAEENWSTFPTRVEKETQRLLDLFDRHQQKATFFILGYVARNHPSLVQEIARRGHELGTHSDMHQLVYQQEPEAFERDLVDSISAIEKAAGKRVRAYRAPGFSITRNVAPWAFDILVRNGIEVDGSVFPAPRAHGGISGFPVAGPCSIETRSGAALRAFPMSVKHLGTRELVFSGGGYFRLTPKPLLMRLFDRSEYTMTYFHPRDFDPEQPIAPGLSRTRRFKSYVGLKGAFGKLDTLLGRFEFITLGEAEAQIDWEKVPVVDVS